MAEQDHSHEKKEINLVDMGISQKQLQEMHPTVSFREIDVEIDSKQQEDLRGAYHDDTAFQDSPISDQRRKANRLETFFSLLKSFFGIGILATPSAFSKVGIIAAIISILIIGFLNEYSMRLLARLGEHFGRRIKSYSQLGQVAYGQRGASFVNVNIILSQVGFCIAYLLFIGEQMEQVICVETNGSFCEYKALYIFLAFFCVLPIVWLPSVKHLAYPALLANLSIFLALFIILYQDDVEIEHHHKNKRIIMFNILELPYFFGIAVFDFEGNGIVLNLRGAMKKPEHFMCLLRTVIIIVVVFLITFCTLSYEAYGQYTQDIITLNLPAKDYTRVVQILYCIGLLCTYPLMMNPAFDIIEKAQSYKRMRDCCGKSWVKKILVRSSVSLLSATLAVIVPKFGLFINLTGAVCCTFLAFILPGFFFRKIMPNSQCYDRCMTLSLIIFGSVAGSLSFVYTVIAFVHAFAGN